MGSHPIPPTICSRLYVLSCTHWRRSAKYILSYPHSISRAPTVSVRCWLPKTTDARGHKSFRYPRTSPMSVRKKLTSVHEKITIDFDPRFVELRCDVIRVVNPSTYGNFDPSTTYVVFHRRSWCQHVEKHSSIRQSLCYRATYEKGKATASNPHQIFLKLPPTPACSLHPRQQLQEKRIS
jgi:hypothetical protein